MPIGSIGLIIAVVLVYFGVAERVLDRMRLSDRAALIFLGLVLAGSFVNLTLVGAPYELRINLGGGVIPLGFIVWLGATAGTARERWRALIAALVTGGAIYALGRVLPSGEPGNWVIDPTYLFGLVGGVIGYLAGRSRRAAFIAGIGGTILADLVTYVANRGAGLAGRTWVGGGGAFDSVFIAGFIAVGLAELVGETRELLQGGPRRGPERPPGLSGVGGREGRKNR